MTRTLACGNNDPRDGGTRRPRDRHWARGRGSPTHPAWEAGRMDPIARRLSPSALAPGARWPEHQMRQQTGLFAPPLVASVPTSFRNRCRAEAPMTAG